MAKYQILYWHEIPSQVDARDGGTSHKERLGQRFQELIDIVAMKRNLFGSDQYLDGWRKGDRQERAGSAAEVAKAVAMELEDGYEAIRVRALAGPDAGDATGGRG